MVSEKSVPKGYVLYNSIYISFLKRQNYENGKEISGCQQSSRSWTQKDSGCDHNKAMWGKLLVWKCSACWVYQCQYSGYDIVPQVCRTLPLEDTGQRVQGMLLHYFLQLYVKNLYLKMKSLIKKINIFKKQVSLPANPAIPGLCSSTAMASLLLVIQIKFFLCSWITWCLSYLIQLTPLKWNYFC